MDAAANAGPRPGDPNKSLQQLEQEIQPRVTDANLPEFSELRPGDLTPPREASIQKPTPAPYTPSSQPIDDYEEQQLSYVAKFGYDLDSTGGKRWDGLRWVD